ncbi:MAG: thiamine diphosphokinase [Ignavibacteriae bacterium HGW-Ignavibacteriae-1]|jgi:thiamine pyrophosphokinase|nr:MAG: thiamine diphosphokinase [Ignavibacteriae bacterium HGW-Ignavibacteriae-1]
MKQVIFDTNKFDALLCLNSELPDYVFELFPNVPIIAADGAVFELQKRGLRATKVIGDLDSGKRDEIEKMYDSSDIIEISDQETNDFEKCLLWLEHSGMKNILILGLHGGLLEHTLNNWSILMRYGRKLNLCNYELGRYGIPIYDSIKMNCVENEIVSLIPNGMVRLTTRNLKWELDDEILEFSQREGARNVAVADNFEITVSEGSFLLFVDSRLPFSPIFL